MSAHAGVAARTLESSSDFDLKYRGGGFTIEPVTIGRIVHYVLDEGRSKGQVRPAIVVRVWDNNFVNLQVFTDGQNDADGPPLYHHGHVWKTSVVYSDHPAEEDAEYGWPVRTWHWPPRS